MNRLTTRGQSVVELALILPLLLLLFLGIIEFGRAMHVRSTLITAARAGVRTVLIEAGSRETAEERVRKLCQASVIEPTSVNVIYTVDRLPSGKGGFIDVPTVVVEVEAQFTGLIEKITGIGVIPIRASARATREGMPLSTPG